MCNVSARWTVNSVYIADETLTDYCFLSRYYYTKSKNYIKDDFEFVTEFPCVLGHPVFGDSNNNQIRNIHKYFFIFSVKYVFMIYSVIHKGWDFRDDCTEIIVLLLTFRVPCSYRSTLAYLCTWSFNKPFRAPCRSTLTYLYLII